MRKPRAGADTQQSRHHKEGSTQPPRAIARSASDRLHLAMVVTLVAVAVIAFALPLTRSTAGAHDPAGAPALVVADGLSATLYSQAQMVANALTQAAPTPTSQAPAPSQSLDRFPAAALVPRPLLTASIHVLLQGALAGPEGQQSLIMQLQEPVRFTLYEEGFHSAVFSTRPTVGSALAALGVEYNLHDQIMPPPETHLTAGLHVFVQRAAVVILSVGADEPSRVYTHAETVAGVLAEQGVQLSEADRVTPDLSTRLRDGLVISMTVVNEIIEFEDTPIPFRTIYRNDLSLPQGEYAVVGEGVDGFVRREYSVVYENGEEISWRLLSEVLIPPTDRIVVQGTAVVVAAVVAPASLEGDPQCARALRVWATWYTAASAGGSGTTATGTSVRKGTVAVDPRVIPLGTRMYIPGYGYGTAEDTGGGIIGHIIDLGYGPDDVKDWRSGWVQICILN